MPDLPSQRSWLRPRDLLDDGLPSDGLLRRVSASTADHYRAVPLGDGYHILFTDPKTGNLCLGTDAPVGSLNRLVRKIWFRPPIGASTGSPVLYAAGADTRHGVRVMATFSVQSGDGLRLEVDDDSGSSRAGPQTNICTDKQMIVFYSIPPDMFQDISQAGSAFARQPETTPGEELGEGVSEWIYWRPEETCHTIDANDPFWDNAIFPLEIQGQPVAVCCNLVELAVDAGPDLILWAFSAEGWARTWALDTSLEEALSHTVVQQDGSLRHVDPDGNFIMAGVEQPGTSDSPMVLSPFDGTVSARLNSRVTKPYVERYRRLLTGWEGSPVSGTVSVDLVEELSGIARMDVELR